MLDKHMHPPFLKLESDELWRESNKLAEYIYDKLKDFPEEEKWETQRKLRSSANDLLLAVGQALGSAMPSGKIYDWSNARKYAAALKTMYRFAGRQKFIELDPTIMLRLDTLLKSIDERITESLEQDDQEYQRLCRREMKPWLERYEIWKKISG